MSSFGIIGFVAPKQVGGRSGRGDPGTEMFPNRQ
jgi:hypothetical protein